MVSESGLLFPIRVLSQRTGVGSSTLRAWERRYGLLQPKRTPKGHRLYSEADVEWVKQVVASLEGGLSLALIAQQLQQPGEFSPQSDASTQLVATPVWDDYQRQMRQAVAQFAVERLDALFNEATALYPLEMVIQQLIEPILSQLGQQWQRRQREREVAEEHLFSSWLRGRISARFHHAYTQASGPRVVAACVAGCFHETGLLLFSLMLLHRGYRVIYLGADLPLHSLPLLSQQSGAKAVVLSVQTQMNPEVNGELMALLPQLSIPIMVGGESSQFDWSSAEQQGVVVLGCDLQVALRLFCHRIGLR
ncbi:MerR family transcriptional regulator [Ectothiorhodospiraceae bacterium BW-2]|nr:MerR family transcriptional regulator [Ectothiorhodospiraceae bacterium BW-2]